MQPHVHVTGGWIVDQDDRRTRSNIVWLSGHLHEDNHGMYRAVLGRRPRVRRRTAGRPGLVHVLVMSELAWSGGPERMRLDPERDGPSGYHHEMTRKATTGRPSQELEKTSDQTSRGHGASGKQSAHESLQAEIDRVRENDDFVSLLKALAERDREILDSLAE